MLDCSLEEGGSDEEHVHTESCYTTIYDCDGHGNKMESHEHVSSCFPDPEADLETAEDWEATLPELTDEWYVDISSIAVSQIGVRESTDNHILDKNGEKHGITRYGQWYGDPYGEWNAMFVCFCLSYAGVDNRAFPYDSDCYSWQKTLMREEKWKVASPDSHPIAGELVFSDIDQYGKADSVGIIVQVNGNSLSVVEGDSGNAVAAKTIDKNDITIIAYAMPLKLRNSDLSWVSMTDDEKVAYLISEINKLPSLESVQEALEAFEDNDDVEGMEEYYNSLCADVREILYYYYQLSTELRESVTNSGKLLSYSDMFEISQISTAAQKPARDNSDDLETIQGVDTRSFIELNLYNYGNNINDLFYDKTTNTKSLYPGFQQNGGDIPRQKFSRWGFGLGDNITTDLMAGIYAVTGSGALINSTYPGSSTTYPGINLPASMADDSSNAGKCQHVQIMNWTLGDDGYPVAHEGNTSLKYLFSEDVKDSNGNPYANKMNNLSITGLFKYNPSTGVYSYNSRENHAQFNSTTDSFTLYKQRITPNFILYPFGNFLPFNDIVHQSKKSVDINENYFQTIANSALYKSQTLDSAYSNLYMEQGKSNENLKTPYANLARTLDSYITIAKKSTADGGLGKGSNWTAMDLERKYYDLNTAIPAGSTLPSTYLDDLYNIDYDEEVDFFFGMEMKMDFVQSRNGINTKGKPTVLKFTGDDDVLFYIDDVLFLDLSGIHRHVGGEIDFKKGEVRYYHLDATTGDVDVENPDKAVLIESFDTILRRAGKTYIANNLTSAGTFPDYSSHTLNWYYMERGSGSGVCRIEFNLEQVLPSGIYKVNQYGESVPGAGFAVYKAKKVNDVYNYLMPDNTCKTSADISSVNADTGVITFSDNTTLSPSYLGHTDADGSMVFTKEGGETMSLNDMRSTFGENFILREIKVPPGYRLVAAESWMAFSYNTLYCDNTLVSGTWAAPNSTVMATEDIHRADNDSVIHYYTRTEGNGDVSSVNGTLFAVIMRKCTEERPNLSDWHPVVGSDFDGYTVYEEGGIANAIEAAKTYKDKITDEYTHVFKIGQMYMPDLDSPIQIGMIATINEMPGEPDMYYTNVWARYVAEHPSCTAAEAAEYALENSRYSVVYFYTSEDSLSKATPSNTVRINPRYMGNTETSETFRNFYMQWSSEVQVPNVVNSLYFQKTDITGKLINNAVFGLYDAVKGNSDRSDGYYKADLSGNTQYYVRLDTNSDSNDNDAEIYDSNFVKIADGEYTIGTSPPNLETGIENGLLKEASSGVITVTSNNVTVTLTPVCNANGDRMLGVTHDSCSVVDSTGTGHFSYLMYKENDRDAGRYFLKELYAPEGYILSKENVKVVVLPDAVYANAGSPTNNVMVGNGPGYIVKTLSNFASKGSIADSLCWTYGLLRVDNSTEFGSSVFLKDPSKNHFIVDDIDDDGVSCIGTGLNGTEYGDPYNNTDAMVIYYEYAGAEQESGIHTKLFDYKINDRSEWNNVSDAGVDSAVEGVSDSLILWSKQGWSDLSIYQDYEYGHRVTTLYPHSTYRSMGSRDIVNLFSSSTFVRVSDEGITKMQILKEDGENSENKLEGAKFILKMTGDKDNTWTSSEELYYDNNNGIFRLKGKDESASDFVMMTDSNGAISINAPLVPGEYTLLETQAPLGYSSLSYAIKISVTFNENKNLILTAKKEGTNEAIEVTNPRDDEPNLFAVHIKNFPYYILPNTGGMGIYPVYVAGGFLVFASALGIILLRKKDKMEAM